MTRHAPPLLSVASRHSAGAFVLAALLSSVALAQGLADTAADTGAAGPASSPAPAVKPATSGLGGRIGRGLDARLTPGEELVAMINGQRARHQLPLVAWSPSLARVAEAHALDLERHPPAERCNTHSWSDQGRWSACCYTDDGARAQCMWDKPREISAGVYPGNGYEIAAWASDRITPSTALRMWQGSPSHLSVMLNQGVWAERRWRSVGAALSLHHAVVWFGEEVDPAPKDR